MTSETKASHTPGPWERDPENDIRDSGGDILAFVQDASENGKPPEEFEANARLIAAAPDLLAACKAFLADREESHLHGRCAYDMITDGNVADGIEEAVRKAEGGAT